MTDVRIEPTTINHVDGFRAALDQVAREGRYLVFVEAPSPDDVRAFITALLGGAGLHVVAVTNERVVGWCDIVRNPFPGFTHSGRLGMGIVSEFRRRGIGRQLLTTAVARAGELGMTRVELEVFASNRPAIALYDSFGFAHEGVKRAARRIDGAVDDVVLMAVDSTPPTGTDRER